MRSHQKNDLKRSTLARFSVLTRSALALIFFIVRISFEPRYCRALVMMFFLIANVVYHPLEILCAETHHAISGLPIQHFSICEFMIDVVRTCALQFSNPVAN